MKKMKEFVISFGLVNNGYVSRFRTKAYSKQDAQNRFYYFIGVNFKNVQFKDIIVTEIFIAL